MGQTEAALADAPGMDEPGLRQTLAIYQTPAKADTNSNIARLGKALLIGGGDKSPLPNVHLAVDPPAATTASIKPVAGLPPAASP
jgi:hypothetical protein